MRYDEINLETNGTFKINSVAGQNGQAIGYFNDILSWIDVESAADKLTISGYNYIIVKSGSDPIENGLNLYNAHQQIQTFDVGGLNNSNRLTLLLMPGKYDLGENYLSLVGNVDIVGLSTNPYHVSITSTGISYPYFFLSQDINFTLENVYLIGDKYWWDTSTSNPFYKLKNVIIGGQTFEPSGGYFSRLIGDFENIKVLAGACFGTVNNSIDGSFKNIEIIDCTNSFYCGGTIAGKYENITISASGYCFSSTDLSGTFENIKINSGDYVFYVTNSLTGTFNNITLPNSSIWCFYSDLILGDSNSVFENIKGNSNEIFRSPNGTLNGKFKNIEVGTIFNFGSADEISPNAKFQNIKIGSISSEGAGFNGTTTLDGTYDNITIYGDSHGLFLGEIIYGTYSNINIGDVLNDCFCADIDIFANFYNIKIGECAANVLCANGNIITNRIKNLKVGNITGNFLYPSANDLSGIYEDITIGSFNSGFYSLLGNLYATFSNVRIGNCNGISIGSIGEFSGSINNLTINTATDPIIDCDSFLGNFYCENIKLGNVFSAFTTTNNLSIRVRNLEATTIGPLFTTNGLLSGTYENIEIDTLNGQAFTGLDTSSTIQNLTVGNLKVNTTNSDIFKVYTSGTGSVIVNSLIKDVKINSSAASILEAQNFGSFTLLMTGTRVENFFVGSCLSMFRLNINQTSEIKNIYFGNGEFSDDSNSRFDTRLRFSNINANAGISFGLKARIERTKIVIPEVNYLNFGKTYSSFYTIYNEADNANSPGPPTGFYVILDAGVTF